MFFKNTWSKWDFFYKEIEIILENQIPKLKNSINEKFHSTCMQWVDQTENRSSELEDRNFEITQLEANKEKKKKEKDQGKSICSIRLHLKDKI